MPNQDVSTPPGVTEFPLLIRETPLAIDGPCGPLEALCCEVPDARGVALICHPNPVQGGTMLNKVVSTLQRTARDAGLVTLRFNYRGVGASAGSQVHAVHGGRVVFADWLRGAGLLVILDHGNGYLSLYGHNQSLLKDAGDIVSAGEAIATVGTSGGQDTPALYFAIRQQGRPTDPAQWCRG